MKRDLRGEIRALLLAKPDGLTISSLCQLTKASDKSVRHSLGSMPDAYIDRWEYPRQGPLAAVYVAVPIPENCPRPVGRKRTEEERREYQRGYTAAWHAAKKLEPKVDNTPRQGLTAIRGPWPT